MTDTPDIDLLAAFEAVTGRTATARPYGWDEAGEEGAAVLAARIVSPSTHDDPSGQAADQASARVDNYVRGAL